MDNALGPTTARLLVQLINNAEAKVSTNRGHSVEIALFVEGQPCTGSGAIGAARKSMNNALRPATAGVSQLVSHAAAAFARARAARHRRSVEIALRVERHALVRFASIRATGKMVKHGMSPSR